MDGYDVHEFMNKFEYKYNIYELSSCSVVFTAPHTQVGHDLDRETFTLIQLYNCPNRQFPELSGVDDRLHTTLTKHHCLPHQLLFPPRQGTWNVALISGLGFKPIHCHVF